MAIEEHVVESTGIYCREILGADDVEVIDQLIKAGSDLEGQLECMESDARDVLEAEGLTIETALSASELKPIVRTAKRLMIETAHLRRQLADPKPDVRAIALQSIRVGKRFEQLCVRPFEALVRKERHIIKRNGRSCVVTDAEYRMLCHLRDNPNTDMHGFVRGVFDKFYDVRQRAPYDQQRSRLNTKLFDAEIGLSIEISGDMLTLSYF